MARNKVTTWPVPEPLCAAHTSSEYDFSARPRRYVHRFHLLGMRLQGKGLYMSGRARMPEEGPMATLLPVGDDDVNGLSGLVESCWVGFHWPGLKIKKVGLYALDLTWGPGRTRVPRWKLIDAESQMQMLEIFRALTEAMARPDLAGTLEARAWLIRLLAYYIDLPEGGGANVGHRTLARFCALLRERACDDITIEDLAFEAGGSADHLRELFRARMGVRPVTFRTSLRMYQARKLLSSTGKNVSEVAQETGYPDPLYFSRVFKKQFKLSPREVIRRYRMARG